MKKIWENIKAFRRKKISEYRLYKNSHGKHQFIDRSKGSDDLCIILAGYKEFLWDSVFGRLKKFVPESVDVCVVSSGMFNTKLNELCERNNWSYLSQKKNNLCLAQNLAIIKHNKAKNIYKLDEDMFITKEFFHSMKYTYDRVKKEDRYDIGFIAPLIPINGYGYIRLLEKFGKLRKFESKFGKAHFTGGNSNLDNFTKNPNIPIFFWKEIDEFKDIDVTSDKLGKEEFTYSICPIRFSIGSIYFKRELWEEMGMFDVGRGNGMAMDEIKLCSFCNTNSYAIVVSENCLVGHLAYGPQMETMRDFYTNNTHLFL